MSFLDSIPDLSGTILTQENLRGARNYLKGLISSLNPKWLAKPRGQLGIHWNDNGQSSATYLIDLAFHLDIVERAITDRSRSIFEDKVIQLLTMNSETDFQNLITELRVFSFFAQKIKPIDLDPLVPEKNLKSPNRPKTPDFSFNLPAGRVLVEVTVFYFQPFILWKNNVDQAFRYIEQSMYKHTLRRILGFSLPLDFKWLQGKNLIQSEILLNAITTVTGEMAITINGKQIIASWRELPHIQNDLTKHPDPNTVRFPKDRYATFDGPKGLGCWMSTEDNNYYSWFSTRGQSAVALESRIQAEDVTEMIVKSIRNTLDRKREQLRGDCVHIVVSQIAHHELTSPEILRMVQERIWPNQQYEWLSGILLYAPRVGFSPKDKPDQMYTLMNPNATYSGKPLDMFISSNYAKIA